MAGAIFSSLGSIQESLVSKAGLTEDQKTIAGREIFVMRDYHSGLSQVDREKSPLQN